MAEKITPTGKIEKPETEKKVEKPEKIIKKPQAKVCVF